MVESTARTIGGRCLLRPTPEFTKLVNGIVGRALSIFPVALHSYVFLANHLHTQSTSPDAETQSRFDAYLLRRTALAVQAVTGWQGPVWDGRYEPIPILDDLAAEQRLHYNLSNGTKEGLVRSPLEWPGPSSARSLASGKILEAEHEVRHRGKVLGSITYPITLTPIPGWAGMSATARCHRVGSLIESVVEAARRDRAGLPTLGIDGILATDPFAPVELEKSPPPLCHATDPLRRLEFSDARTAFLRLHARASRRFRDAPPQEFPEGAFLPSTYRKAG